MQKTKSSGVAGTLGMTLGMFGVHDWYLGRKIRALIHTILGAVGLLLIIIALILQTGYLRTGGDNTLMIVLYTFGYICFIGSATWAYVESFILFHKGGRITVKASDKPPMSAKTKAKIILISSISVGAIILITIAAVFISSLFTVNYGESYRLARDLKTHVNSLYRGGDCEELTDRVSSTYTSEDTYNSYAEGCLKTLSSANELVKKLGSSSGVAKNEEIKAKYDAFLEAYNKTVPAGTDIASKISLYKAWHTFVARYDNLSMRDDESAFSKAAEPLVSSGFDKFKEYANGWIERALAYRSAYKAYWENKDAGSDEYTAMVKARDALRDYEKDSEPDLDEVVGLEFTGTSKMYSSYRDLYNLIRDTYEENYDYGSNDCNLRSSGTVDCD